MNKFVVVLSACVVLCSALDCIDDNLSFSSLLASCNSASSLCDDENVSSICGFTCAPPDDDQAIANLAYSQLGYVIEGCADAANYCNHGSYGSYVQQYCYQTCNCGPTPTPTPTPEFPACEDETQSSIAVKMSGDWADSTMTIHDCAGNALVSRLGLAAGADSAINFVCFPEEGVVVSVSEASVPNQASWEFLTQDDALSVAVVASGSAPFWGSNCQDAGCDASLCAMGETSSTLFMFSNGDGWGSSSLDIFDCQGNAIETGLTLEAGSFGQKDLCLPSEGLSVVVSDGLDSPSVSWNLVTQDGSFAHSGGAPHVHSFCP